MVATLPRLVQPKARRPFNPTSSELTYLVAELNEKLRAFEDLIQLSHSSHAAYTAAVELQNLLVENKPLLKKAGKYDQLIQQLITFVAIAGISLHIATQAPDLTQHNSNTPPTHSPRIERVQATQGVHTSFTQVTQAPWISRFLGRESAQPPIEATQQAPIAEQSTPRVDPVKVIRGINTTALRRAIIGQESGGRFNAVNPHSGALGYGQVMPFNIEGKGRGWDFEILGRDITPEQFLKSPELQIKIINGKLEQYVRSQTVEGRSEEEVVRRVASIWYSGRANLWNDAKPQTYNGHSYPSIAKYTGSIWNRYLALAETPTEIPQNTNKTTAQRVVDAALEYKGHSFKPEEFARCADWVRHIFRKLEVPLAVSNNPIDKAVQWNGPHSLRAQSFFGTDVGTIIRDKNQLKPGDLIAWANTYGNFNKGAITHVGIYVGNGMIIDRSTRSQPIRKRSIDTFPHFVAGVRPHAYSR